MPNLKGEEIHDTLNKARDDVSQLHDRIYKVMLRATLADTAEGNLLAANLQQIQFSLVEAETQLATTASFYSDTLQ